MILSWIVIALGVLIGVAGLIRLKAARGKAEMAEPRARSDAWSYVRMGLVITGSGVTTLGVEAANHTVEWVGRGAGAALAVLIVFLLLRSYRRGRRNGAATTEHT
jgi:hypothetical protein